MISKYQTKILKINSPLRGYGIGAEVKVRCEDGQPIDPYWRRRIKDAKIDKCVEIISKKKKDKTGG